MAKIVLFPKVQIDTSIAYFLLKTFGKSKFPDIDTAEVLFWSELPSGKDAYALESEGYILIDLGGGRFDHHSLGPDNTKLSSSHLVAQYLEIDDLPELQKLLELARRDDLLGKGTISQDQLDRAFGLPGLVMSLVKSYPENPDYILSAIMPFLHAHYLQEYQKYQSLPQEYSQLLESGDAVEFMATQLGRQLKVVLLNSDNHALTGFIRSRKIGADLVIQRASSGHVNFVSNQKAQLRLHELVQKIKLLEAEKNNIVLPIDSLEDLFLPGRTTNLPHWYYDTRANTLQNGGINPGTIPPTKLSDEEIISAVKQGLNISRESLQQKDSRQTPSKFIGKSGFNNRRPQKPRAKQDNYRGRSVRGAIIID